MTKKHFCRGVIIAHGKSEKILAEYIKSNLHLPIGIYSDSNTSIQINDLNKVLRNTVFKNRKCLKNRYEYEEDENKKPVNFFVMPVMDLDDADEETIEKYKSKEMFKGHWLEEYIIPIWNDANLDEVLYKLGIIQKIPSDKEKGKVYGKIFPIQQGETDVEGIKTLSKMLKKSKLTNMDICIDKCLEQLGK